MFCFANLGNLFSVLCYEFKLFSNRHKETLMQSVEKCFYVVVKKQKMYFTEMLDSKSRS